MPKVGTLTIDTELNTKSFDKQIKALESKLDDIEQTIQMSRDEPELFRKKDIQELEVEAEKLRNQLTGLYARNYVQKPEKGTANIAEHLKKIVKRTVSWGLALFGIRGAYSMISSAMGTLSQYNEQIGTDIQYIRYAIATTFEPLIKRIISLAFQLLQIINTITMSFFNLNLFERASVDGFNKMTAGAKALNKQLAGFDEMNVLSDTSGGGGVKTPSVDLSKEFAGDSLIVEKTKEMIEATKNLYDENRAEIWDLYRTTKGIFGLIDMAFFDLVQGIINIGHGLFDIIAGLIELVVGIFMGDTEKIMEAVGRIGQGIVDLLGGLLQIILSFFEFIGALLIELVASIFAICSTILNWVYDHLTKPITETITSFFNWILKVIPETWNKIVGFFGNVGTTIGNAIGGAFKSIINSVLDWVTSKINGFINSINSAINFINAIPGVNIKKLATVSFPRLAKGGIINQPGRGINYAGANIGERGAEGIIPLTDSQQMALLGEAIGRYITINASITNTMNGRIISRELQRVQNNNEFATNR